MRLTSPVLVGRDLPLRVLATALRAAGDGEGQATLLLGDAGIGKSRLAAELRATAAEAGMPVFTGRTSTTAPPVPFRPLAEAMLSVVRITGMVPGAELLPYRPALGRLIPEWSEQPGGPGADSVLVLAESILRLLAVVSRATGCVLILEDLHDADPETLAVVEYLIDNLDRHRILLLATSRPGTEAMDSLAASAARRRAAQVVDLKPLSQAETASMVAHCLAAPESTVPAAVTERLAKHGDGNPFVVEELLSGMVEGGHLVRRATGWTLDRSAAAGLPSTVVLSVTERAQRLGKQGHSMLCTAATLGRRFSLRVVQHAIGADDELLRQLLSAAVSAQLIAAEPGSGGWYAFRHALTADALLSPLLPTERASLAARLAVAVEAIHPDLPGDWCQQLAQLRLLTGDEPAAAALFAEAGRRALSAGAAASAAALLEKARGLYGSWVSPTLRAELLEPLLSALTEAGQTDRALDLGKELEGLAGTLDGARLAALHTRLAEAAVAGGRWRDGLVQVGTARAALGAHADPVRGAPIDVVEARLLQELPGDPRSGQAETLARRALSGAERLPLPDVACQALEVLGIAARTRSLAESEADFQRMLAIAEEHRLPAWRITAFNYLGANDWLNDGVAGRLRQAKEEALRLGALPALCDIDSLLAMLAVLHAEYEEAEALAKPCGELSERLKRRQVSRYLSLASAVSAAHRGRRQEMEASIGELLEAGGEDSHYLSVAWGLAEAVCSLLEEDRARARAELERVRERDRRMPTPYSLAGTYGLGLLLRVASGDGGWADYEAVAGTPQAKLRWNKQFVLAAKAVLHGRDGDPTSSGVAAAQAQEAAAVYPLARHLILRLIADPALDDGWGSPVHWARGAAEYFHRSGLPAIAQACHATLRRAGASVFQQRRGWEAVPPALREVGVTVREYEVLVLLGGRLGNQEIGQRLYISARTAEKHVASLLSKLDLTDRAALCDYAAGLNGDYAE
ncbi:helix-turn-helix transcriptional regulator [Longispora albida]|uniref:helix-turn-helix transcriptional regulator n=1 Tax=Longispora albida TaxID=203523 RepID=UPI00036EDEB4|nr:AAA family ATPase [Longispora albida]